MQNGKKMNEEKHSKRKINSQSYGFYSNIYLDYLPNR